MKTILVVEDSAATARVIQTDLEHGGYRVIVAHDAITATTIALREKPDLVMMDLIFPGGGGVEVIKRMKQLLGAPIIVLTGAPRDEIKKLGLVGISTYIAKPHDRADLLAQIERLLSLPPRNDEAVKNETDANQHAE